jgi:DNA-binding LacI/PurR family transcriptional regulator
VTLRDVAKKAGVSHATVSLSFRNHHSIPEARRRQILKVAEEMGYRPDPMLSALAEYRRNSRRQTVQSALGWLNCWRPPGQLRKFREFDLYWQGAARAAERLGYHLEEMVWAPECSARRMEQILLTRGIRGLLIPPHPATPEWGDFDWSKFSAIRFGMGVRTPQANLVTADQQRAVLMAFEKMHQYGYRRIGLVTSRDFDARLGGNYIGGFAAAQELLGFRQLLPPLLLESSAQGETRAPTKEAIKTWLAAQHPDAILTTELEVPGLIQELGYEIPRDVAVAGTGADVPVDAGINQNSEAIGQVAVESLVALIKMNLCGQPAFPCRVLVESTWQDGKSLPSRR